VIPPLLGPYLLGQRVEVKTRAFEYVGVAVFASRAQGILVVSDPGEYVEERGSWTHGRVKRTFLREQIERLMLLEGPARPEDS
jgi:hypothetical protein